MFKSIENLKIDSVYRGVSKKQSSNIIRKINVFILRTAGSVRYTLPDRTIDVHPGEIVFLPKGITYDFTTLTDTPCEYVSIRFEADLTYETPSSYPLDDFQEYDEFTNSLPDLWKFGGQAERYKCYSVFYNLLAYLENLEKLSYIDKKKFNIISPAVSYLKKHIYDSDLKIETLIDLCGISGTYFHKIFRANFNMSPQNYILGKRLSHAKIIIDSGDFDTISEVSASVGYNDPLYFSRAFKKKYGTSPSQYARD